MERYSVKKAHCMDIGNVSEMRSRFLGKNALSIWTSLSKYS